MRIDNPPVHIRRSPQIPDITIESTLELMVELRVTDCETKEFILGLPNNHQETYFRQLTVWGILYPNTWDDEMPDM